MKIKESPWAEFGMSKTFFIVFFIFCLILFSSTVGADPIYSQNSTNSTLAGTPISHNLYWTDSAGLSGYVFQFCNGTWNGNTCDGFGWSNDTWTNDVGQFSGDSAWSNVTKLINSTLEANIAWCVYANDTSNNWNGTCQDPFFYVTSSLGHLEVNLTNPDTSAPLNVMQNKDFDVNSTIICRDGPCGEVFGTIMYNLSSTNPDTPISSVQGDKPFFIQESPANSKKSCGTMNSGDACKLNWTVNATGDPNTIWKVGVLFNSSYAGVTENNTESSTISIFSCSVDFNLSWSSIRFGLLDPGTGPNEAPGNVNKEYNITVNPGSCNLDFYINGTDLINTTLNSKIGVGNISWSNTSNDYGNSFGLSSQASVISINATQNTNITTWYWINVPPVYSGYYNGTIYIFGVENGENAP
jgi:hypothetical protein